MALRLRCRAAVAELTAMAKREPAKRANSVSSFWVTGPKPHQPDSRTLVTALISSGETEGFRRGIYWEGWERSLGGFFHEVDVFFSFNDFEAMLLVKLDGR